MQNTGHPLYALDLSLTYHCHKLFQVRPAGIIIDEKAHGKGRQEYKGEGDTPDVPDVAFLPTGDPQVPLGLLHPVFLAVRLGNRARAAVVVVVVHAVAAIRKAQLVVVVVAAVGPIQVAAVVVVVVLAAAHAVVLLLHLGIEIVDGLVGGGFGRQ